MQPARLGQQRPKQARALGPVPGSGIRAGAQATKAGGLAKLQAGARAAGWPALPAWHAACNPLALPFVQE